MLKQPSSIGITVGGQGQGKTEMLIKNLAQPCINFSVDLTLIKFTIFRALLYFMGRFL
jgi:hypothetical protein